MDTSAEGWAMTVGTVQAAPTRPCSKATVARKTPTGLSSGELARSLWLKTQLVNLCGPPRPPAAFTGAERVSQSEAYYVPDADFFLFSKNVTPSFGTHADGLRPAV